MEIGERPDRPTAALADPNADELGSLARELARGYAGLVESHRRSWGVGAAEADAKAREHGGDHWVEKAAADPPNQLSWWALALAAEQDPAAALAAWGRARAEARDELRSGHRSAAALEWSGTPWDRARFLAIRDAFAEAWRPRGGIEAALVDALAQSFAGYLRWTERATTAAEAEGQAEDDQLKRESRWRPPGRATAAWIERCSEQAERCHRRFLATLKALQDLRRLPAVFVAGAGQVNLAAGPQLNVAAPTDEGAGRGDK